MKLNIAVLVCVAFLMGCHTTALPPQTDSQLSKSNALRDLATNKAAQIKKLAPKWEREAAEAYDVAAASGNAYLNSIIRNVGARDLETRSGLLYEDVRAKHEAFFELIRNKDGRIGVTSIGIALDALITTVNKIHEAAKAADEARREQLRKELEPLQWKMYSEL